MHAQSLPSITAVCALQLNTAKFQCGVCPEFPSNDGSKYSTRKLVAFPNQPLLHAIQSGRLGRFPLCIQCVAVRSWK